MKNRYTSQLSSRQADRLPDWSIFSIHYLNQTHKKTGSGLDWLLTILTSHIPFKLNCDYHLRMSIEKNRDFYFCSKTNNRLAIKLQNLLVVCHQNLYHVQKYQKQAHNKRNKPKSYVSGNKIWPNSKYIKNK